MLLWVRLSTGSPRMKKAATVAKTHLDDVLGNLYVDVAVDDNDDEAVGDDVFVDLKKGLNMPAVLMLTKTWMIHKFRFWRFSIPPYKLKPLKNVNSGEPLKCLAPCCWDSFNQQYPRLGKVSHQPKDAIGWPKNNDSSGQSSGLTQDRVRASWLALHFFMETCAWNDAYQQNAKKKWCFKDLVLLMWHRFLIPSGNLT